jgi:hypothetical protein
MYLLLAILYALLYKQNVLRKELAAMTKEQREQFQKTLEIAQQRRNELIGLRATIENELAQQSRAIAALAELLGEPTANDIGLTGATLLIVRTAKVPIAPTEVRDELKKIGYDMDGFSNPMASLHQILKRLEEKREIEEVTGSDGKKRYRARVNDPFAEMALAQQIALKKLVNDMPIVPDLSTFLQHLAGNPKTEKK